MNNEQARVLSFASVCEAAAHADRIATGQSDAPPSHLLGAVFAYDQSDLDALFQPQTAFVGSLDHAADLLRGELTSAHPARYTVSILKLATSLGKSRETIERLRQLLEATPSHQQDAHRAAEIYSETLSKLSPTIVIHGTRNRLAQPNIADAVRATLLAGVRFAWMWQQLGGRQWHLLIKRRRLLQTINEMRTP